MIRAQGFFSDWPNDSLSHKLIHSGPRVSENAAFFLEVSRPNTYFRPAVMPERDIVRQSHPYPKPLKHPPHRARADLV